MKIRRFFYYILLPLITLYSSGYSQAGQLLGTRVANTLGDHLLHGNGAYQLTTYQHQVPGNLKLKHDVAGTKLTGVFSSAGTVTSAIYTPSNQSAALTRDYTYSPSFRLQQSTYAGNTINYIYTTAGHVSSRVAAHQGDMRYAYQRQLSPYQGKSLTWQDSQGQYKTASYGVVGISRLSFLDHNHVRQNVSYQYDAYGRPLGYQRLLGAGVKYTYNPQGLKNTQVIYQGANVVSSYYYRYNPAGNMISSLIQTRDTDNKTPLGALFYYDYNRHNQLVSFRADSLSSQKLLPKDDFGHRIQAQQFSYTANGNIDKVIGQFISPDSSNTTQYHYDTASGHPDRLQSINYTDPVMQKYYAQAYQRDRSGNLTQDAAGNRYHYNILNQLIKFTSFDNKVHNLYAYNAQGKLAWQSNRFGQPSAPPVRTDHFYVGHRLVQQFQGANQRHFAQVATIVSGDQGDTHYPFQMHQGTAVILSANGVRKNFYTYSPYGWQTDLFSNLDAKNPAEARQALSIEDNAQGFSGQIKDSSTGLMRFGGYRNYAVAQQQFIQPDSEGVFSAAGPNRFAYAKGNPIRYKDPTGHWSIGKTFESIGLGALFTVTSGAAAWAMPGLYGNQFVAGVSAGAESGAAMNSKHPGRGAAIGAVSSAAGQALALPAQLAGPEAGEAIASATGNVIGGMIASTAINTLSGSVGGYVTAAAGDAMASKWYGQANSVYSAGLPGLYIGGGVGLLSGMLSYGSLLRNQMIEFSVWGPSEEIPSNPVAALEDAPVSSDQAASVNSGKRLKGYRIALKTKQSLKKYLKLFLKLAWDAGSRVDGIKSLEALYDAGLGTQQAMLNFASEAVLADENLYAISQHFYQLINEARGVPDDISIAPSDDISIAPSTESSVLGYTAPYPTVMPRAGELGDLSANISRVSRRVPIGQGLYDRPRSSMASVGVMSDEEMSNVSTSRVNPLF